MSGLFSRKSREEQEAEKQQAQSRQQGAADRYDALVTKSLEQLTRWAFPDSQVERSSVAEWKLWHTTDDSQQYVDVTVTLEFDNDAPQYFNCDTKTNSESTDGLSHEALNDALRWVISSS